MADEGRKKMAGGRTFWTGVYLLVLYIFCLFIYLESIFFFLFLFTFFSIYLFSLSFVSIAIHSGIPTMCYRPPRDHSADNPSLFFIVELFFSILVMLLSYFLLFLFIIFVLFTYYAEFQEGVGHRSMERVSIQRWSLLPSLHRSVALSLLTRASGLRVVCVIPDALTTLNGVMWINRRTERKGVWVTSYRRCPRQFSKLYLL